MSDISQFLIEPYSSYSILNTVLEIVAVVFGFLSVWYSKNNNVLVYPTGMISTSIYVYLLLSVGLIGDMLINGYYFFMSIYGWYYWTRFLNGSYINPISRMKSNEYLTSILLFVFAIIFVFVVYFNFNMWNSIVAYIDTITTAIFFVGMWLMARRKIENWLFWIIGDIISIPLYFYKGMAITSFQYIVFTFLALAGYIAWKKEISYDK